MSLAEVAVEVAATNISLNEKQLQISLERELKADKERVVRLLEYLLLLQLLLNEFLVNENVLVVFFNHKELLSVFLLRQERSTET